jgi:diaminopropionate ammonia-lyase
MQGYTTMGYEMMSQLEEKPTHLFLQAGVGSMAGAMAGFFAGLYGENRPKIIVVEPDRADCLFRTAKADDGTLHNVTGDMNTIMAGLACGEPCSIGWKVLDSVADGFLSVPERVAADGMRILAAPCRGDSPIVSGESGAAAFGAAANILLDEELADMKAQLGLDEHSRLLFISTEGDTDRENYRNVVWRGKYPGVTR